MSEKGKTNDKKTVKVVEVVQKKITPTFDQDSKLTLNIIACFATGIVLFLSLFMMGGTVGSYLASFLTGLLGYGAFFIPVGFIFAGFVQINLQKNQELRQDLSNRLAWGIFFMLCSFVAMINIFTRPENIQDSRVNGGGIIGYIFYQLILEKTLGVFAGTVVLITIFLFGFFLVSNFTFVQFFSKMGDALKDPGKIMDFVPDIFEVWNKNPKTQAQKMQQSVTLPEEIVQNSAPEKIKIEAEPNRVKDEKKPIFESLKPKTESLKIFKEDWSGEKHDEKINSAKAIKTEGWNLPPFAMLEATTIKGDPGDIEANKKTIQDTLAHFGIIVEMGEVIVGPTVSQYPFRPQNGVKLSAIDNLQRDLALSLAVANIRIHPIPKTTLVGIEVPNKSMSQVRMRDLLQTNNFIKSDKLTVAVGQDVAGKNILFAIAEMPHLLVAGATGSGKSVWINGMLVSLLFKYAPHELGLILVDMKRVELKLYDGIPHLLTNVITESDKAINALKWAVLEMDKRYQLLESHGKRNIVDFNEYAGKSDDLPKLSYIVFVIDELADLMIMAKSEVEPLIARLTQMARAVGIHIVLGTQRPDTTVITGLIKTNVPTRIAFAVPSEIDSRVILGAQGADKLLGKGDGLMLSPRALAPIRFQGAFVDEEEVRECVNFLKNQVLEKKMQTNIKAEVVEPPKQKIKIPGLEERDSADEGAEDEVYEEAKRLVVQYQKASASFLQQMMGIGYPKAARIVVKLEEKGIIGPQNGAKPRDVYMTIDELGG